MSLNLNEKLRYFAEVLSNTTDRAWHYVKPERERFPYAIWTEYSEEGSLPANNRKKYQPVAILLDYFTQTEFDPEIDRIQDALNSAGRIQFELTDIQYEEETAVIHYSWTVNVYGEGNGSGV
jgi:hypothetical protein